MEIVRSLEIIFKNLYTSGGLLLTGVIQILILKKIMKTLNKRKE
jgi:hypothetical protein